MPLCEEVLLELDCRSGERGVTGDALAGRGDGYTSEAVDECAEVEDESDRRWRGLAGRSRSLLLGYDSETRTDVGGGTAGGLCGETDASTLE